MLQIVCERAHAQPPRSRLKPRSKNRDGGRDSLRRPMNGGIQNGAHPEACKATARLSHRSTLCFEQTRHVVAELAAHPFRKREQQQAIHAHPLDFASRRFDLRLEHERFQTPGFCLRDTRAERRQTEVAPALVVFFGGRTLARFRDEALRQHRPQRAIEVARHDPPEAAALLHVAHEAPAVTFVVCESDQDLEDERLERQVAVDLSGESGGRHRPAE